MLICMCSACDAVEARHIAFRAWFLMRMKEFLKVEDFKAMRGVAWRERSPIQKRRTWVGQRWREGSARWANRVGKERHDRCKSYFRQKHTFCKRKPVT